MKFQKYPSNNIFLLCSINGYDRQIYQHLEDINNILKQNLNIPFTSILYGSFARGEPTFVFHNGHVEIFSDYDIFVYTGQKSVSNGNIKRDLRRYIENIGMENTLFHVGIKIRCEKELRKEPFLFHIYDILTYGFIIFDKLNQNINLKINISNLVDSIPLSLENRLWYTLLYLPDNHDTVIKKYQTNYLLLRNILELISAICILEGYLPKSYLERYNYARNFCKSNTIKQMILKEDELLYKSVITKRSGDLNFDPIKLILKIEHIYNNFLDYLFDKSKYFHSLKSDYREDIKMLLSKMRYIINYLNNSSSMSKELSLVYRSLIEYSKRRLDKYPFEKKDQYILYLEKVNMWNV